MRSNSLDFLTLSHDAVFAIPEMAKKARDNAKEEP